MSYYNQKYQYNTNTFTKEDQNSFYLLGAYMSDGHIRRMKSSWTIGLTSKDKDWLETISNHIGYNIPIKNNANAYVLDIHNKQIAKWLISYGCIPNKSLTLEMPNIPSQYLPDFIRGYIDGDGSVVYNPYEKTFYTGTKKTYYAKICIIYSASLNFITELKKTIDNLGFKCVLRSDNRQGRQIEGRIIHSINPLYNLTFTERNTYNFIKWVYYPNHQLSLARKKEKANQIIQWYENSNRKPMTRLTNENVIEIRKLLKQNISHNEIGKLFNVTGSTINYIASGKTWGHIIQMPIS